MASVILNMYSLLSFCSSLCFVIVVSAKIYMPLRHANIVPVLELLKCSISFWGVGRVPARPSLLAWPVLALLWFVSHVCAASSAVPHT